jgi:hypothetical protein
MGRRRERSGKSAAITNSGDGKRPHRIDRVREGWSNWEELLASLQQFREQQLQVSRSLE